MLKKIVIVEDEKEIAQLLVTFLTNESYQVDTFAQGLDALAFIKKSEIDLVLLDVMLPDTDGFSLLQEIRKEYYFPVIMLTAKGEALDTITGLTLGADDYITKPFNPLEVIARVKTQLRRYQKYNQGHENTDDFEKDGLRLIVSKHKCLLFDEEVNLTPLEFKILLNLFENQGTVVTSEILFEAVWEEKYLENNNTVMAHIARLREKLGEAPRKSKFIKTVWGVGYTIEE